ncbi:hypothetical protein ACKKBG_A03205 [Auxenochlorella protothecoides x Auxenochlorella symbiontica]
MTFRLDDGTTIRSSGEGKATVLKARESFAAGLLSETHLLRVQALLCEVHAKLPDEGPLKTLSLSSKRSAETDVEALDIVSAKRSHSLNGHGPTAETASALPSPQSAAPAPLAPRPIVPPPAYPEPFAGRCLAMVDKVITALGGPKDAAALGFTVAVDAKLVPDYYTIVRNPIHLGEIRGRLRKSAYADPSGFYQDMHLLFDNCFLYNPEGTAVHRLGSVAEATFEREWARSPYTALVPARALATPAYDLPAAPPRKPNGGARARSGRGAGGGARRSGGGRGGSASAVHRTKSVNSYRAYTPLPADKQAALAAALQDEAVLAGKMAGVVDILQRADELPTNEDGEVELDLGVLSPKTVWALYEYVIGPAAGGAPRKAAPGAAGDGAGFQLAEDSDYAPDDDDDD